VNANRFIILTHGRAGSTYLQHLLSSHPLVACDDEIFNVSNTGENSFYSFSKHQHPTLSYFFLRESISRSSLNLPLAYLFKEYLKKFYSKEKEKTGFRLIYDQLLYYRPLVDWVTQEHIPIIHLQRSNPLKAIISLIKARETGVYTATSQSLVNEQKFKINPTQVLNQLNKLLKEKSQCQSLLRDNPMLNLTYEDLFEDQSPTIQRIMDFLGITDPLFHMPDIVKLNPEKISELLENYEEVKQALSGTRWEKYLD
jgi:LPS sulfotransferase NodH